MQFFIIGTSDRFRKMWLSDSNFLRFREELGPSFVKSLLGLQFLELGNDLAFLDASNKYEGRLESRFFI